MSLGNLGEELLSDMGEKVFFRHRVRTMRWVCLLKCRPLIFDKISQVCICLFFNNPFYPPIFCTRFCVLLLSYQGHILFVQEVTFSSVWLGLGSICISPSNIIICIWNWRLLSKSSIRFRNETMHSFTLNHIKV
jgi:hypothetical protein